jgi:hypothetical protein
VASPCSVETEVVSGLGVRKHHGSPACHPPTISTPTHHHTHTPHLGTRRTGTARTRGSAARGRQGRARQQAPGRPARMPPPAAAATPWPQRSAPAVLKQFQERLSNVVRGLSIVGYVFACSASP